MTGPFSLAGRTALVTGGASGIGAAVAAALAAAGADVAVTVHRRGAAAIASAVRAHGVRFAELAVDLAAIDAAGAAALFERAAAELAPVDILVNGAGTVRRAPAAEHAPEDWRAVLALNLDAVWFLTQAAGRGMLSQGGGAVVTIASLLSFQGGVTVPGYAASKHGVAGLTKALANEWAPRGVRVNAVAPGYIATSLTAALREDAERDRQILERIPAGRWGDPEDVAGAVVFLASPAARYVHGHVLAVDGGWLAR